MGKDTNMQKSVFKPPDTNRGLFIFWEVERMNNLIIRIAVGIAGTLAAMAGVWLILKLRKTKMTQHQKVLFITTSGILAGIASILRYLETPLPLLPTFLKIDFSNIPALIGSFALGPVAGIVILLIKNLLYLPASGTGGVGEIADFICSLALVLPAALIYQKSKNRAGALWGMALGTVLMSFLAGPLMNYYVLIPLYSKFMPIEAILKMAQAANPAVNSLWTYILYAVIPFNLFKSIVICAITYLLYKPLSPILHKYR
jgi:riboflavin transporter